MWIALLNHGFNWKRNSVSYIHVVKKKNPSFSRSIQQKAFILWKTKQKRIRNMKDWYTEQLTVQNIITTTKLLGMHYHNEIWLLSPWYTETSMCFSKTLFTAEIYIQSEGPTICSFQIPHYSIQFNSFQNLQPVHPNVWMYSSGYQMPLPWHVSYNTERAARYLSMNISVNSWC